MYSDIEIQKSYEYLEKVVHVLKEPICIMGGWAVFLTVNDAYQKRFHKPYLGSRDIDLGFHLKKKMTLNELKNSDFAHAINALEKEGYESISFKLVQHIDRNTGNVISSQEAEKKMFFDLIEMYVDLMVDYIPASFKKLYGFEPIDEPLLEIVFADPKHQAKRVEYKKKLLLPVPALLVASKLKSLPNRTKDDKRLKDIFDLASLLLFSPQAKKIPEKLITYSPRKAILSSLAGIKAKEIVLVEQGLGLHHRELQSTITALQKRFQ